MNAESILRTRRMVAACLGLAVLTGCNLQVNVNQTTAVERLTAAVTSVQADDPRTIDLPTPVVDRSDTVIIDDSVDVIVNIEQDLVAADLPDQTVLGIANHAGFDIYVRYFANAELQAVYVFDGDTLLLAYSCLDSVEFLSEDDFAPDTGELVDSFDLTNALFVNPGDFICGDAFIVTFNPLDVEAVIQTVVLLP